jgi:hypothetical protein
MNDRVILDLCGGTGSWARPYEEAGYKVIRVTLPEEDVRLVHRLSGRIHGILAAPPCTVFANAGARWPRTNEDMIGGLSVVDACLRAVVIYEPQWWALENPAGKLSRYLGKPTMTFQPCDYGDPWTKRTCLWGKFAPPTKSPVEPTKQCKHGTYWLHCAVGGKGTKTMTARSVTPAGFAQAFFEANP